MDFESSFTEIPLADAHATAERMKADGARFVQILAVNTDNGIDLYYTYDVDGKLDNYKVVGLTPNDPVPSITDVFLAAFVFENEARELFGVDMRDVAIDFGGHMYTLAEKEPMTFLSPELAAAKEKARKAAAAKAAKAARDAAGDAEQKPAAKADADIEAKLAGMDPEKAAKVRAALEKKAAREAAEAAAEAKPKAKSAEDIEAKLAGMDPEKAAKVRAALEKKAAREAAEAAEGEKGAE